MPNQCGEAPIRDEDGYFHHDIDEPVRACRCGRTHQWPYLALERHPRRAVFRVRCLPCGRSGPWAYSARLAVRDWNADWAQWTEGVLCATR